MEETRYVPLRRVLLVVGLLIATGCSPSPKQAEPEAALDALKSALESWKGGQTRDAFAREKAIQTADSRWEGRYRLLDYQIGPPVRHGYDVNFVVTLKMEDNKGKKLNEKATYTVGTTPKLVVLRVDEM